MLQAGRSWVRFTMRWIFSTDLILDPGVDSAFNRNEYQEYPWGVKGCRRVRLTNLLPSVSRFSGKNYGSLEVSQPNGLSRRVTGIYLPFYKSDGFRSRLRSHLFIKVMDSEVG
jgi:hypothetical protein